MLFLFILRLQSSKDSQNTGLVSATPSRSKTSGRRRWTADQGLIDRRAYLHVVHRIRLYALVYFKKKNVGWHKTFLNMVMESFYQEIVLSEDFYKLID